jgi:hydrogenase expression/formation protein HypC
MCLAVPAEVTALTGVTATVSVEGAVREVDVSLVEGVAVGDYVLVHAGFALHRWSYDDVLEWRALMEGVGFEDAGDGEEAP